MTYDFEKILSSIETGNNQDLPPVESWEPEIVGQIDIHIDNHFRWFHEGSKFERQQLIKLLSKILRKDGDDYFLVTPQEKMRIQVDDVPFEIIHMQYVDAPAHQIKFVTNTEDVIILERQSQWELRLYQGLHIPYINVRHGLWGRVSRNLYYQMIETALAQQKEADADLCISSAAIRFSLGQPE